MSNWQSLTFGVEIETITSAAIPTVCRWLTDAGIEAVWNVGTHSLVPQWKVVPDGSVRGGCEVVSPILKGDAGLEQLRRVMEVLTQNGCTVNRTCGLHVHVGARGATARQVANVARMFIRHELNFDRIVSPSRRGNENHYCQSNRARARAELPTMQRLRRAETIQSVGTVVCGSYGPGYHHSRYHKLNTSAYATHGTIEFRQHQGTVDAEKACHWVRLVTGFVAVAFSAPDVNDTTDAPFEQLMRMTDAAGERYFTARRDHFDPTATA